jgi:THUMP domain-like
MPWHERTAARKLRELGIGTADIRRRGLPGDVAQIHRRLGLEGDASATIVITRREGRPWSLICVPVTGSDHPSP